MQFYDYGEELNLKKYGTALPPAVPLENLKTINLPMAIYAGFWDYVTSYNQAKALNDFIGPKNVEIFHV